jgi:TonB family protein
VSRCLGICSVAACVVVLTVSAWAQTPGAVADPAGIEIPEAVALEHVTKGAQPTYPAVALSAGIHGIVKLAFSISVDGVPIRISVKAGNPLLDQAAIVALGQFRFQTFRSTDGSPVVVRSTMTFSFATPAVRAAYEKYLPEYERLSRECSRLGEARDWLSAVTACDQSWAYAKTLPQVLSAYSGSANVAAGQAHRMAGQLAEALPFYERELARLTVFRFESDTKAQALLDVAQIHRDLGDLSKAEKFYENAIDEWRAVLRRDESARQRLFKDDSRATANLESRVARNVTLLKAGLVEYIDVLKRRSRQKDAAKAERLLAEVGSGKF